MNENRKTDSRVNESRVRGLKHLWMVEDVPASGSREARSFWTKVGVAFENRDGSWSLELSAIPVNGRLQMREPKEPSLKSDDTTTAAGRAVGAAA